MVSIRNTFRSCVRNTLNYVRRKAIKNPKTKKRVSVMYHNLFSFFDFKQSYDEELFDYKRIIGGKKYFHCDDVYYGNSMYGNSKIFKDYSGYQGRINACIEHGLYFGDTVFEDEAIKSGMNGLLTFGDSRVNHLKKMATVQVIPVGPYIHYAKPLLLDSEIEEVKRKNGRTLLVFPSHSIDRVETEFDYNTFNAEIQRVVQEQNIAHVMICLFFKDIIIGRDKFYIDHGYQVVCNGYRCDPMFLRRLKTFILLSDFTMSNDVGTNVGYCIYLGKPHYVYNQSINYNAYIAKDMENVTQSNLRDIEVNEVKQKLNCICNSISADQYNVCNKYWGFSYIRDKKQMYEILDGFCSKKIT